MTAEGWTLAVVLLAALIAGAWWAWQQYQRRKVAGAAVDGGVPPLAKVGAASLVPLPAPAVVPRLPLPLLDGGATLGTRGGATGVTFAPRLGGL